MDIPAAEVTVDAALVARLIEAQHPDLAGPLTLVANGWDNALYRLGDNLCVRLPRRKIAVELIVNEQRWLPEFAARVSIPVPVPVRVGVATDEYPWPWSISPWFEGLPAVQVPPVERASIATDLADFMKALHVPAPPDAPPNPARGVPLHFRSDVVFERLAAIPESDPLRLLWEAALEVPAWSGPPVWIHGDPHPANILLTHGSGKLAAMLDFGDLTAGDPATDLAAGWMLFDEAGRKTFRARVDPDDHTWARARGWAVCIGTAMAVHSDNDPKMVAISTHTLAQVLTAD